MAVIGGPSGAAASVVATLNTYVPGEMDAIWTIYNDAAQTPEVKPITYLKHQRPAVTTFPHIQVYATGGTMLADHSPDWKEMEHKLVIEGWVMADSELSVQEQCARHLWAVEWALAKHQALDGNIPGLTGVTTGAYSLSPLGKHSKTGKILQGWRLEATVHVTESPV